MQKRRRKLKNYGMSRIGCRRVSDVLPGEEIPSWVAKAKCHDCGVEVYAAATSLDMAQKRLGVIACIACGQRWFVGRLSKGHAGGIVELPEGHTHTSN